MKDIISSGYAERVPVEEVMKSREVWYIPHLGVYHKKKPGKIGVAFHCSAVYDGQSLNHQRLQGLDMTNNLIGILCRFRQERIAFVCDIQESIFHQVNVDVEHPNLLKFLWWDNPELKEDPVEFRMTVHLFRATSSPRCANFALNTAADLYEETCGSEAADFVRRYFYVDDGLGQ